MSISPPNFELILSKLILSGTDQAITKIPKNTETVVIYRFEGSVPSSSKADVRLIWDFNGTSEEILWNIQTNGPLPNGKIFSKVGDGVKKMALCLANGGSADYVMSGFTEGFIKNG